jgi:ribosomal protein S18 acetylase RimI-like enzyme
VTGAVHASIVTSVDTPAFGAALDDRRALIEECNGVDWDTGVAGWRDRYTAYYRGAFETNTAALVVCTIEAAHAGSCVVSIQDEFRRTVCGAGIGYLNGLYVRRDFRRNHIGTALVAAAIEWLGARGCPAIRLHPTDASLRFYQRLGFAKIAELEYRASPAC